jgi:hypothetical protein
MLAAGDESGDELTQMKELILSLSRETDDAVRRKQVAAIFARELDGTAVGDKPPHFTAVFSTALERVGTEVQERAREKAEKEQQEHGANPGDEDGLSAGPRQKTAEELQLWALVDMMVQSKMLVRKATVAPPPG